MPPGTFALKVLKHETFCDSHNERFRVGMAWLAVRVNKHIIYIRLLMVSYLGSAGDNFQRSML